MQAASKALFAVWLVLVSYLANKQTDNKANYITKTSVFHFLTSIAMLSDFLILWNLHVFYYHDSRHVVA